VTRPKPALVSVVIPVFNGGALLGEQLEALSQQDYTGSFEVIISNNGSTDDTVAEAQRWSDRLHLRIVECKQHRNASQACNEAYLAARGELLAHLDHDDVASPQWLSAIVDASLNADLVGGQNEYDRLNARTRSWRPYSNTENELPIGYSFLPFIASGNFAIWAEVSRDLGGFNSRYPYAGMDCDICWRAQLASFRFTLAPGAIVHIRFRDTLGAFMRQQYRWGYVAPKLFSDFHVYGMPRRLPESLWSWVKIVCRTVLVPFSRTHRSRWAVDLAFRAGRVAGSLRYRSFFI
jgi:glycosyltransferase involved in cell wall biosynthesis